MIPAAAAESGAGAPAPTAERDDPHGAAAVATAQPRRPGAGDWRPTATRAALARRAELAAAVRAFFAARGVLEVETPLLSSAATPEPHLASLAAADGGRTWYLATSPELHMKRLLAAGCGPIFQLARAVRGGECGRRHNREFTLLEWYRPGWDHHRLIDEVEELLAAVLGERAALGAVAAPASAAPASAAPAPAARDSAARDSAAPAPAATRRSTEARAAGGPAAAVAAAPPGRAERLTYAEAFRRHAGLDPHRATLPELDAAIAACGVAGPRFAAGDRDGRLHLLMALVVEPALGPGTVVLSDFPASQASLARVRPGVGDEPAVAERFEVFVAGVELANGFHELADAAEQRRRFAADLAHRRAAGLPEPPVDERFLAALEAGLPPAAGVALGFDRLVMLATGAVAIDQVIAFPADRA